MDFKIRGKNAIVTGAGQGIGRATAVALAEEGVNVAVCDVNIEHAEDTAHALEKLGVRAIAVNADVSQEEEVKAMFAKTRSSLGPVEILVNNAGISPKVPFDQIPCEQFRKVMEVNLLGTFLCCQQAFADMKEKNWGRIINLSSMAGLFGANKAGVHYSSTKAGIIGLTKTLAKNMGPYQITVNCVAPGRINTALTQVLAPEVVEDIRQKIPMHRIGEPEEVAWVIAFLASQQAGYVTGACVDILGGYIA